MLKPIYSEAKIIFPGKRLEEYSFTRDSNGKFVQGQHKYDMGSASFTTKGCLVMAFYREPFPEHLKGRLPENELQRILLVHASSCLEEIGSDLKTMDKFWNPLFKLSSFRTIQSDLYYKKQLDGFFVYDYSHLNIFEWAKRLLVLPEKLVNPKYKEIRLIAKEVQNREKNAACCAIKGKTLGEAVEKAIKLYEFGRKIKKEIPNFEH